MNYSSRRFFRLAVGVFCLSLLTASVTYGAKKSIAPAAVQHLCLDLHRIVKQSQFIPDLIIGISRGGLVPLGYLSGETMFDNRNVLALSVQSYEGDNQGEVVLNFPLPEKGLEK